MVRFVDPRNDVAFRKIFGNEQHKEILISFLNAILGLSDEREITDIEILNPYQAPKIELLKETILDVRAKNRKGITFIVEMQVAHLPHIRKRFTYYVSKAYASQMGRGDDYPRLNQVVFIGILDFKEFEGDDYLTRHVLLNTSTYRQDLEDLEFNFVELPKFNKQENELETILDKWIYFIKYAGDLKIMPSNAIEPSLQVAYEMANQFTWSMEEVEIYDYRGIRMQDERGSRELATQKGWESGMKAGMEAGQKAGMEAGTKATSMTIARALLTNGMDKQSVAQMTNLSIQQVEQLGFNHE